MIETLSQGALQTSIPGLEEEVDQLIGTYDDLYSQAPQACIEAHRNPQGSAPAEAHEGIIKLFVTGGKFTEAVFALEKLIESFPDYAPAHNDLGVLYHKQGHIEKALGVYEKAVSLDPENATFKKNLADFLYVTMKRPDMAVSQYQKALEVNPHDKDTLLILGNIEAESGKYYSAKDYYLRVLEVTP